MCLCLIAFKLARVKNFYKNQDLKGFATLTQSNKVKYMLVFMINYFNLNKKRKKTISRKISLQPISHTNWVMRSHD
jgi:hypothetical protein